jgi:signal transduction histidine kinase
VSIVPTYSLSKRRPARRDRRVPGRRTRAAARYAGGLLAGGFIALAAIPLLVLALATLVISPLGDLGVPFLAVTTGLVRPLARAERRRVRLVTGVPVAEAYKPLRGSLASRVRTLLSDVGTWRDLGWLLVQIVAGGVGLAFLAAAVVGPLLMAAVPWHFLLGTGDGKVLDLLPLGAFFAAVGWSGCSPVAKALAALSGQMLEPDEAAQLRAQMEHLAETRDETVDARAAELRRIERDLHDGAQARLVSLTMSLGMAEEEFDRDLGAARQLVVEARVSARAALSELRHLVRGIHPPVLTERGLCGAVEALALASAVPVEVDVDLALGERLPAPLESALYFVIAEAMANIARHSEATWAFVRLWMEPGKLRLMVHDDGHGGADPASGSGLRGIQQRLAAFDGKFTLSSPVGGPTELFAELPWCQ